MAKHINYSKLSNHRNLTDTDKTNLDCGEGGGVMWTLSIAELTGITNGESGDFFENYPSIAIFSVRDGISHMRTNCNCFSHNYCSHNRFFGTVTIFLFERGGATRTFVIIFLDMVRNITIILVL